MQITLLGTGLVGNAMARDLAAESRFSITAIDFNQASLSALENVADVKTMQADLSDPGSVEEHISSADLVICAVPGFMGFATLKAIIDAGKNVVDISFFPEDALSLDDLAREKGVIAVVDCGIAPGLCNIQAGKISKHLDSTDLYECYVGGLPVERKWPYEYKAVFSPIDVLEVYTRPARFVEHGKIVIRPALSGAELRDFPGVGTLESFNTDGLRSLIHTMDIPFMIEKTLRFPGHIELMRVFRESGFFGREPIDIGGCSIRPLDLTSRLMFDDWHLAPGEHDFTVMQVILEGRKDGRRLRYTYDLLDHFDTEKGITSMARTTGYTCTLIARQVIDGLYSRKGVSPPEFIGRTNGCYEKLLEGYAERDITVNETITELD